MAQGIGVALVYIGVSAATAAAAAAVIEAALIGAVIGGLTAAVTGGDILKGVLYGGIGGAVAGGLGYAASGSTGGSAGGASGAAAGEIGSGSGSIFAEGFSSTVTDGLASGAASSAGEAAAGGSALAGSLSGSSGGWGSTLLQGGISIAGNMMKGQDASEEADKLREFNKEENQKTRDNAIKLAELNSGAAVESAGIHAGASMYGADKSHESVLAQIAEQRRQYDTTLAENTARRQRSASALEGVRLNRNATGVIPTNATGIDQQVAAQTQERLNAKKDEELV